MGDGTGEEMWGDGGGVGFIPFKPISRPKNILKPAFAAMHNPHSLVRIGPGCADRA